MGWRERRRGGGREKEGRKGGGEEKDQAKCGRKAKVGEETLRGWIIGKLKEKKMHEFED